MACKRDSSQKVPSRSNLSRSSEHKSTSGRFWPIRFPHLYHRAILEYRAHRAAAVLVFKRALDPVAGESLLFVESGERLPVVSIHAGIFDRAPDVARAGLVEVPRLSALDSMRKGTA